MVLSPLFCVSSSQWHVCPKGKGFHSTHLHIHKWSRLHTNILLSVVFNTFNLLCHFRVTGQTHWRPSLFPTVRYPQAYPSLDSGGLETRHSVWCAIWSVSPECVTRWPGSGGWALRWSHHHLVTEWTGHQTELPAAVFWTQRQCCVSLHHSTYQSVVQWFSWQVRQVPQCKDTTHHIFVTQFVGRR